METDDAAAAIRAGSLVVYPTETVYGLGADATDADAVAAVFDVKGRESTKPVSMAVPNRATAADFVELSAREEAFFEAFLPGPVTVVCEHRGAVPATLTAGRDRVGVRVPDHAGARTFLSAAGRPVTATSANPSGESPIRRTEDLDERIRSAVEGVIEGGETPGGGSTVVDVERGVIHRRGRSARAVERWLENN